MYEIAETVQTNTLQIGAAKSVFVWDLTKTCLKIQINSEKSKGLYFFNKKQFFCIYLSYQIVWWINNFSNRNLCCRYSDILFRKQKRHEDSLKLAWKEFVKNTSFFTCFFPKEVLKFGGVKTFFIFLWNNMESKVFC